MVISRCAMGQDKADDYLKAYRYADAAKVLERYIKRNPEDGQAHEKLAIAYRFLRDFDKAEENFDKADSLGALSYTGYIGYGQVLIKNGKSSQAKEQFSKYLQHDPESFVVRMMANSINKVESWKLAPKAFKINELKGINSKYADFSPHWYDDGLAFTTERHIDHVNEQTSGWSNLPHLAVYYGNFKGPQHLSKPKPFLTKLYGDYHVGPISIDTANNLIYFNEVRSQLGETEEHLEIYTAEIIKGKRLSKPEPMPLNSDSFSVAHPAITPDGNTMYFASNMPGGEGGMDIYVVHKKDGNWGTPVALPTSINTILNEVFPFAAGENELYFASNGHEGYGGLDIYYTQFENGAWSKPKNLKSPINSPGDDFGIFYVNENKGYFSSERDGGKGKDDIYEFIKIADLDDSSRVQIAGLFEYEKLPPEGFTIRLLDEHDNVLDEVQTDSLGNFVFNDLPANKDYKVEVIDDQGLVHTDGDVYLLNDEGQKVLLLDRINDSQYVFTALPKDDMEGLTLMDVEDTKLSTFSLFGQLYSELPSDLHEGMVIEILDDEGNLIRTTTTDSMGLYAFEDLPSDKLYKVRLVGGDSIVYKSTVYYQDEDGIRLIEAEDSNLVTLDRMVAAQLDALPAEVNLIGSIEHDGKPVRNTRLLLVDSNGYNIKAVQTDADGGFNFGALGAADKYRLIVPDSIAAKEGTTRVFINDNQGNKKVLATQFGPGVFIFRTLSSAEFISGLTAADQEFIQRYGLHGQVFKKLPGDYHEGLTIMVLDEEGRIVEMAVADSNGNFDFTKLEADQQYIFQVVEKDMGELNVNIYDLNGVLVDSLRLKDLQRYLYEKLNSEDASMFAMQMPEEDKSEFLGDLVSGMIYKKLPGDYRSGIKIYAIDENGNVIDSAYTDAEGKFQFTKLTRENEFTIQVADETDSEMQVAFFGYNNQLDGLIRLTEDNTFVYSKIVLEAASELGSMGETDDSQFVYGRVYSKLPGDYEEGMKVYAYDEDGNIIDEAYLDADGKFKFEKLRPDQTYFLSMDEASDAQFSLIDKDGNIITNLEQENGQWKFDKLAHDEYAMAMAALDKDNKLRFEDFMTKQNKFEPLESDENTVFFEYRNRELSADDSVLLGQIAATMKQHPEKFVRINAYADESEVLGQRSISSQRSVAIVQFLHDQGVSMDQFYVQNWEASKPLKDCNGPVPCTEEDRAQNQRVSIDIVDSTGVPTPPDYVVTYEFNQWLLSEEHDNDVAKAIKQLQADSTLRVSLDGYADTWGTYNSNKRISELRSLNIRNLMIREGIDASRITLNWHGESVPFGGCLLEYPCPVEQRKQNRRVEIRVNK